MPQAPQLAVVSSASQKPEQHERPAPHGWFVSQPVVHTLLGLQTWVAEQSPSVRHCTHVWFVVLHKGSAAPASPVLQSVFALHPAAHVVPVQYWSVGQLSPVGRHCTHVLVVVSQRGVVPLQLASVTHCTQPPMLHTCPVGHGWLVEQPSSHVSFVPQT
jgi:hypothetical protein